MKFTIIRLIMASIWIILAYKWGDIKNWRKYYPTMLFFCAGDLIYNVVFAQKRLWGFETGLLVPSINEIFVIFTIFFSTTLLFLANYPEKLKHQVVYIILWVAVYMAIEVFTTSIGMQKNYNGWNLWWSLLHNAIQFPLLALHHRKPVLSWTIAFIFLFIIMSIFNVPVILKSKG